MREARAAREVVVSAGTINSPQLLELSGIGQPDRLRKSGHRRAPCAAWCRGESARPLCAQDTVGDWSEADHVQRPGSRVGSGVAGVALRGIGTRNARHGGCADPRIRALPRRTRGAGRIAGLGADADRAGTEGSEDIPPVRRHVLRAPDAAGEQGAHPHCLIRSASAAGDQLQLPVVADRCGDHRARCAHRARRHDRSRDGDQCG